MAKFQMSLSSSIGDFSRHVEYPSDPHLVQGSHILIGRNVRTDLQKVRDDTTDSSLRRGQYGRREGTIPCWILY